MTHWNYRVFVIDGGGYEIREVYYEGDKIVSWTQRAVGAYGDTPEELEKDLALMKRAFKLPKLSERRLNKKVK